MNETWGVTWREWLPADGATARYRALDLEGETVEIDAVMEHGIAWRGETWDRVTFGTVEKEHNGIAVYLDTSEPWVLRIGGVSVGYAFEGDQVAHEVLFEAPAIDILALLGEPQRWEGELMVTFAEGEDPVPFGLTVDAGLTPGAPLDTPAGTFEPLVLHIDLGGRYIGGDDLTRTLPIDVWIHPTEGLLGIGEAHGFVDVLLLEPCG